MKRGVITSTCSLVAAACIASTDPPNLALNPGFEECGPNGLPAAWATDAAGIDTVSFARDTEVKRTGEAAARITVGPTEKVSWPSFNMKVDVQPGQSYNVEAQIKTREVTGNACVVAEFLDVKGARISSASSGSAMSTTPDWTPVALKAQVPPGATAMALKLILHGTGTAWFDDVSLTRDEVGERLLAQLKEPLPPDMLARAITSEGDLSRLCRFLRAVEGGGEFTVGFIGGSITAGASASGPDRQYSAYVMNWLRKHFPAAQFNLVNAGIGATGSSYGCLRVDRDLLSKSPDLVVIEYAVNDGNTQACAETYEGLVRQVLVSPKRPGVMLLFMMSQSGGNAQEWQIKVGRHYNLPMLSYRDLLWPEIEAKRLTWRDISPDTVHPNNIGHAYAGKLLTAMLDRALASQSTKPTAPPDAPLPAPLLTDACQFTALYEADALKPVSNSGWTLDPANGKNPYLKTSAPGSVVEFEIEGQGIFLSFWRIRGPMGRTAVSIDGGPSAVQDAWFDQTWGGHRCMVQIGKDLKPGVHRVRVELLEERNPQSDGREFRILCLGAVGVRPATPPAQ